MELTVPYWSVGDVLSECLKVLIMEIKVMYKLAFSVLLVALISNIAFAKNKELDADTANLDKCPRSQASTLFVSNRGKRKGSAEKLTESHKNAEAQGWSFDEMSLYTENGDLQGFYVTYTRPHPCNHGMELIK